MGWIYVYKVKNRDNGLKMEFVDWLSKVDWMNEILLYFIIIIYLENNREKYLENRK